MLCYAAPRPHAFPPPHLHTIHTPPASHSASVCFPPGATDDVTLRPHPSSIPLQSLILPCHAFPLAPADDDDDSTTPMATSFHLPVYCFQHSVLSPLRLTTLVALLFAFLHVL
ncbi:hypothetical protein GY45DRAFT_1437339 [Cubamyces sp. BRFM 1775]|nr:hypothetical protein GY45DRAFT_1437339 [Cubamyces sp. BRFM 1775]